MQNWRNYLLLVGAGAIASTGFAPFFWWPIALLCLGYLFHQLQSQPSLHTAFLYGFSFGLGHFLASLYWIPRAFWQESGSYMFAIFGGVPALILLAAYCAIFIGLTAWIFRLSCHRMPDSYHFSAPLIFALCWLIGEWLRAHILWGFPWNLIGYIWADTLPLLQLAALGEVWLMSFAVILISAGVFTAGHVWKISSIILLIALISAGQLRLNNSAIQKLPVDIALINGTISEMTNWGFQDRWQQMVHYAEKTSQLDNAPDIIIWPETAVMFDIQRDTFTNQTLANLLLPHQTLVTGTPWRIVTNERDDIYNSIVTLNDAGVVTDTYFKHKLVPFGEFVPMRKFIPDVWEIGRFVRQYQDYSQGDGKAKLDLGHGIKALPLICYEAIFPSYVSRQTDSTDILLNITNDAWFAGTTAPHQHFAMARVRAVAQKRALYRSANQGITARVDSYGRVALVTSN